MLESLNGFGVLLNTTLALIFALTPDGRIVKFNRACEVVTGYTFNEVKDRFYWELFLSPEDAVVAAAAFANERVSYFLNQRGGNWITRAQEARWIEWSNTAMVTDEGIVQLLVGTGIDSTEKKEAQHRTLEFEIQRAKVNELTSFVRGMSHDLRTPLSIMSLSLYMLGRKNQQSELNHHIENAQNEVHYLSQLVADIQLMIDLLDGVELTTAKLNINELLFDLHAHFTPQINEKALRFDLQLPETTPYIVGDRNLIHRALCNVIDNAIRYTPDKHQISIAVLLLSTTLVIEVADTGIGISAEDLPHIFDFFYKVDKARTQQGAGCGLGLTIARNILHLHGGSIEVESIVESGSRFRLIFLAKP